MNADQILEKLKKIEINKRIAAERFNELTTALVASDDKEKNTKRRELIKALIAYVEELESREEQLNQEREKKRGKLSSKPDLSQKLEENKLLTKRLQYLNEKQLAQIKARLAKVREPMSSTQRGGKRSRKNKKSHKKRAKRTHAKRTRAKRARHTRKH
jgi:hypothetical protein